MSSRYQLKTAHESFLYGPLQYAYKWRALDLFLRGPLSAPCLLDKIVQKVWQGARWLCLGRYRSPQSVICLLHRRIQFLLNHSHILDGVIDEVGQYVMNVLSVGKDLTLKACIIFNDELNIFFAS